MKTIQNKVDNYIQQLEKVQNIALQTILLIWRTTQVKRLQKKAATAPIKYTLNHFCELASLQLHKLKLSHSLRQKTVQA